MNILWNIEDILYQAYSYLKWLIQHNNNKTWSLQTYINNYKVQK